MEQHSGPGGGEPPASRAVQVDGQLRQYLAKVQAAALKVESAGPASAAAPPIVTPHEGKARCLSTLTRMSDTSS